MSVRKYEFTVSADSEGVLRRVWGGIQFEDNATEFCFKPDPALLLAAGDGALCRIDINSASGWDPSETLSPNSSGYYCRTVPYSATRFGGEIEIAFVISNENCEILSYPVRAYFTEMSRSPRSEEKVYENISGMEQEVKLHAEGVSAELKRCEELRGEVAYYHTAVGGMKEDILTAGVSADELEATKNEAEALITEVEAKLEAGEFKGEKGDDAVTDQSYNPESPNAQSGIAVAEALANVGGGLKEYELLSDTTITEDVASVKWTTADNGEPISNYKDFFIYFLGKFTAEETTGLRCRSEGQYFLWANFAKKTSVRGFWISIEQIFSTDEIDSAPNATTRDGTAIFISKYPKNFLLVEGEMLNTQGLSDNNQDLRCDTSIMGTTDLPLKELEIFQGGTAVFASGSRFLLLGRKA